MTLLVLFILAVIWAAVLLPPYLQNRSENRPADSISNFRHQLSVLERRATGAPPARGTGTYRLPTRSLPYGARTPVDRARIARAEARKRRRDILGTLTAASGITLAIGVVLRPVLVLHLLIDVLLAGYVALLVRAQRLEAERTSKVRYLPARRSAPAPAPSYRGPELALRRSATN